jgi:ribosome-associated protein
LADPRRAENELNDALRRRIKTDRLSFVFSRGAGPGGQNINKVSTRVTLWFDLDGSDALKDAEKRRIRARLAGRVTKHGHLRVVSMRHRTQQANRRAALDRFYELLAWALTRSKPRRPTKVPHASRQRRLSDKRHRSRRKDERSGRLPVE